MPFLTHFFGWEGENSPTKIDKAEKVGTLILTSLLEDLVYAFKGNLKGTPTIWETSILCLEIACFRFQDLQIRSQLLVSVRVSPQKNVDRF